LDVEGSLDEVNGSDSVVRLFEREREGVDGMREMLAEKSE